MESASIAFSIWRGLDPTKMCLTCLLPLTFRKNYSHLTGGMIYIYVYSTEKIHPSAVLVGSVVNQVFDTVRLAVGIIYKFIDCHSS